MSKLKTSASPLPDIHEAKEPVTLGKVVFSRMVKQVVWSAKYIALGAMGSLAPMYASYHLVILGSNGQGWAFDGLFFIFFSLLFFVTEVAAVCGSAVGAQFLYGIIKSEYSIFINSCKEEVETINGKRN